MTEEEQQEQASKPEVNQEEISDGTEVHEELDSDEASLRRDEESEENTLEEEESISESDSLTDETNVENVDNANEANKDVDNDNESTEDPIVVEESDQQGNDVAEEEAAKPSRFTKSYRIKTLKRSRNLLRGPLLYISYVKEDVHLTCILRSVSWFDQDYLDRIIAWLKSTHPLIDVKILKDAGFNDPSKPDAVCKEVEVPFHDTIQKAFSIINGWKWIPHITFESDEIPSEIKEMRLEIKLSYPNWRSDFDGHKQIEFTRLKGRLAQ